MTGRAGFEKPQDCVVVVSLRDTGGIALQLHSKQESMFGNTIRACAQACLEELGVKNAAVEIQDFGSLDFAIRARIRTAVARARRGDHE